MLVQILQSTSASAGSVATLPRPGPPTRQRRWSTSSAPGSRGSTANNVIDKGDIAQLEAITLKTDEAVTVAAAVDKTVAPVAVAPLATSFCSRAGASCGPGLNNYNPSSYLGSVESDVRGQAGPGTGPVLTSDADSFGTAAAAAHLAGVLEGAVGRQLEVLMEGVIGRQVEGLLDGVVTGQLHRLMEGAIARQLERLLEGVISRQVEGLLEGALARQLERLLEGAMARQLQQVLDSVVKKQRDGDSAISRELERVHTNNLSGPLGAEMPSLRPAHCSAALRCEARENKSSQTKGGGYRSSSEMWNGHVWNRVDKDNAADESWIAGKGDRGEVESLAFGRGLSTAKSLSMPEGGTCKSSGSATPEFQESVAGNCGLSTSNQFNGGAVHVQNQPDMFSAPDLDRSLSIVAQFSAQPAVEKRENRDFAGDAVSGSRSGTGHIISLASQSELIITTRPQTVELATRTTVPMQLSSLPDRPDVLSAPTSHCNLPRQRSPRLVSRTGGHRRLPGHVFSGTPRRLGSLAVESDGLSNGIGLVGEDGCWLSTDSSRTGVAEHTIEMSVRRGCTAEAQQMLDSHQQLSQAAASWPRMYGRPGMSDGGDGGGGGGGGCSGGGEGQVLSAEKGLNNTNGRWEGPSSWTASSSQRQVTDHSGRGRDDVAVLLPWPA